MATQTTAASALATLISECNARARVHLNALAVDHVGAAIAAYVRLSRDARDARDVRDDAGGEAAAQAALISVVPRVLADAADVRRTIRDDPAEPGLEHKYVFVLHEMSSLAAFAIGSPPYDQLCSAITALMEASATASPTWKLLRGSAPVRKANAPKAPLAQQPAAPAASATSATPVPVVSRPIASGAAPRARPPTPLVKK